MNRTTGGYSAHKSTSYYPQINTRDFWLLWGRLLDEVTQAKVTALDQKINICKTGNTTACNKMDTTQIPQKSKEILLMIFRDIGVGHIPS